MIEPNTLPTFKRTFATLSSMSDDAMANTFRVRDSAILDGLELPSLLRVGGTGDPGIVRVVAGHSPLVIMISTIFKVSIRCLEFLLSEHDRRWGTTILEVHSPPSSSPCLARLPPPKHKHSAAVLRTASILSLISVRQSLLIS